MAKRVSRRDGDIDKKLDSNERMTWIEEGGIDLRASREGAVKTARTAKPSAALEVKPKSNPKVKPQPKPKAKSGKAKIKTARTKPRAKARPKTGSSAKGKRR